MDWAPLALLTSPPTLGKQLQRVGSVCCTSPVGMPCSNGLHGRVLSQTGSRRRRLSKVISLPAIVGSMFKIKLQELPTAHTLGTKKYKLDISSQDSGLSTEATRGNSRESCWKAEPGPTHGLSKALKGQGMAKTAKTLLFAKTSANWPHSTGVCDLHLLSRHQSWLKSVQIYIYICIIYIYIYHTVLYTVNKYVYIVLVAQLAITRSKECQLPEW